MMTEVIGMIGVRLRRAILITLPHPNSRNLHIKKIRTLENLPECRWVGQDGPTMFEALHTSDLLTIGLRRGWVR